jgi:hypothetical protein
VPNPHRRASRSGPSDGRGSAGPSRRRRPRRGRAARSGTRDGPCSMFTRNFLSDPNFPPQTQVLNVLGLTGVIIQIRLISDGTTSVLAPWGELVVEKK